MAINKASYYNSEGPKIPEAGGNYGHPDPHSAVADQRPFHAPSTPAADGTGEGVGSVTPNDYMFGNPTTPASYTPTTGSGSDIASGAQAAANAAFDFAAQPLAPGGESLPRGDEPSGLSK